MPQKQKFTPNSPYSLLRAIRPRGRSRHLAVLAQPVQGLMLTEAAQFEMADFKDRCRNFCGKSTSHEQWPANILAEEFQPAEDVDVAPHGGEVEAIARANIAVCGITIVQSNIDQYAAGPRAVKPGAQPALSALQPGPTHRPAPDHRR